MINKIQGYAKNIVPDDVKSNFELEGYINKVIDKVNENVKVTNRVIATQNESANIVNTAKTLVPELKELNVTFGDNAREIKSQLAETKTQFQQVLANVTVDSEVINARTNSKGIVHTTLKNRLDAFETQEPWHTPTLINGWTQDASLPLQYRKNTLGNIELEGILQNTGSDRIIFVLPAGYRPTRTINIVIWIGTTPYRAWITSNGNFTIGTLPTTGSTIFNVTIYI